MNFYQNNQKSWQEKTRKIFSQHKKLSLFILSIMVIASAAYFTLDQAQGGNFQFLQTDWSTGADTTNNATHSSDQIGWSKFFSKNSSLNTTGGETKITTTQNSFSQTSNSDFASNTNSNTAVFNNSIRLLKPNGASCAAGSECQTNNCSSNLCSAITGQVAYTTPGTYSWTVPAGVTSVSVVCVGGGGGGSGNSGPSGYGGGGGGALSYGNNMVVNSGANISVVVGSGGNIAGDGGNSTFGGTLLVAAGGKRGGYPSYYSGGLGGVPSGTAMNGGGNGGNGGLANTSDYGCGSGYGGGGGGGGGAGGYSGNGGEGGKGGNGYCYNYPPTIFTTPAGGGGAGGSGGRYAGFSGGGVGILGQGSSGVATLDSAGTGGSGGGSGTATSGGSYGGGGGSYGNGGSSKTGSGGACRIIWPGTTRQFPSTNTGDM